jgi:hypothetical protein
VLVLHCLPPLIDKLVAAEVQLCDCKCESASEISECWNLDHHRLLGADYKESSLIYGNITEHEQPLKLDYNCTKHDPRNTRDDVTEFRLLLIFLQYCVDGEFGPTVIMQWEISKRNGICYRNPHLKSVL